VQGGTFKNTLKTKAQEELRSILLRELGGMGGAEGAPWGWGGGVGRGERDEQKQRAARTTSKKAGVRKPFRKLSLTGFVVAKRVVHFYGNLVGGQILG
jgi:hypothetical protein